MKRLSVLLVTCFLLSATRIEGAQIVYDNGAPTNSLAWANEDYMLVDDFIFDDSTVLHAIKVWGTDVPFEWVILQGESLGDFDGLDATAIATGTSDDDYFKVGHLHLIGGTTYWLGIKGGSFDMCAEQPEGISWSMTTLNGTNSAMVLQFPGSTVTAPDGSCWSPPWEYWAGNPIGALSPEGDGVPADLAFKLYGRTIVPEPSILALTLFGIGVTLRRLLTRP